MNARSLNSKSELVVDFMTTANIDVLAVPETWLGGDNGDGELRALCPSGFSFVQQPRGSRGGGIALLYNSMMTAQRQPASSCSTFELLDVVLMFKGCRIRLVVIYRPPAINRKGNKRLTVDDFLLEFESFMEVISVVRDKLIIVGDFNLHVDDFRVMSSGKEAADNDGFLRLSSIRDRTDA